MEIQRMLNVKTKVIPAITGGAWNHFKVTETNLSNIPGKHEIKELQKKKKKNIHIGRCTHTAGSADRKVQNIIHGRNNITCSTDCKQRTATTLFTLETWFVSGI